MHPAKNKKNMQIGFPEILRSSGSRRIKIIKLIDYCAGSLLALLLPGKNSTKFPSTNQLKRILVIRPGGIGDAILLIPLLRLIKKSYPSLRIDILCEKRNQPAFLSQQKIYDHLYCYDILKSLLTAFKNKYDAVIDTEQWHYLSALVSYFLNSPLTIGFASRPLRAKLFNIKVPYDLNTYELLNFRNLFSSVFEGQHEVQNIANSFKIPQNILDWAQSNIPDLSVSLYLGGSLPEKRLTKEQSLSIIQFILENHVHPILLGGRDILEQSAVLEQTISDKKLINLVGKTSLEESGAVIKRSKVFVGTDSGIMHLASAVGTPVVALFGSSNRHKWGPPQDKNHVVISNPVACSPCAQFSYSIPTCQRSYICMTQINLEAVKKAIKEFTN